MTLRPGSPRVLDAPGLCDIVLLHLVPRKNLWNAQSTPGSWTSRGSGVPQSGWWSPGSRIRHLYPSSRVSSPRDHQRSTKPRTPGWWFLVTAAAAGKEHSLGALPQVCVQGSQRGKVSPHPEWRGHHSQKSLVLAAVVLFKPLLISLRDGPGPRWNPTSVSLHFSSPSPLWAAQQSTASWAAENIRNLFFSKFWRPEVHDQPVGSVYLPHPPTPSRAPLAAGTCSAHVSQPVSTPGSGPGPTTGGTPWTNTPSLALLRRSDEMALGICF
ncbi:uncharacterized protein LOC119864773 isoform X11 [Canis lupus familiaris]|uniref:uncharacterized protein LOC119864773 isoform X11 n=1 Tax=Canis lupus familiaris TaxID=9615 RepID=UPI0018F6FE7E|nr:uncharacterized protein LOC119864773 isoform X11 [Canis lupus familiaris]